MKYHMAALMLNATCPACTGNVRHAGDPDDLSTVVEVLLEVTSCPCCVWLPHLQAVMALTQLCSGMTDKASCHVCRL